MKFSHANGTGRKPALVLALLMALVSCRVTENYTRPSGLAPGGLYRDMPANDTTSIADMPWNQVFTDTVLQGLIREGISNNPDLKIAMSRIAAAQANLRQRRAAFYPDIDAHAAASDQRQTEPPATFPLYQLYGSASWEIDFWGKLRSAKRAALAALLQSEAYQKAVQTQLVAEIASDYFILMAYDAQLHVALKTVENRTLDVATVKELKESSVVTGAAVVQSEANLYSVQVTIPDIRQNIRETENALSILLGRNPGEIRRDSLAGQHLPADLLTGVPARLLSNRPDVEEAEYQFRYYFELTNVAKTYFYPSVSITASGGLSATSLTRFFSPANVLWSLGAGLVQPIFNQGLNRQRLAVARAQQEEYLEKFKKTLLNAGAEVSDAMSGYQTATDKIKIRSYQIASLQKALDFTRELLKYTEHTNYTDVLTSDQNLLAAQLSGINDRLSQLLSMVSLYRSLGGGWK